MPFELTPAQAETGDHQLVAQPEAPSASDGRMGRFIQIRVNGVDLGDDRVEVIDFICPQQRG